MEDTKASFRQAPSSLSSSPSAFCKRCATEKRRMQYYSLSLSLPRLLTTALAYYARATLSSLYTIQQI